MGGLHLVTNRHWLYASESPAAVAAAGRHAQLELKRCDLQVGKSARCSRRLVRAPAQPSKLVHSGPAATRACLCALRGFATQAGAIGAAQPRSLTRRLRSRARAVRAVRNRALEVPDLRLDAPRRRHIRRRRSPPARYVQIGLGSGERARAARGSTHPAEQAWFRAEHSAMASEPERAKPAAVRHPGAARGRAADVRRRG